MDQLDPALNELFVCFAAQYELDPSRVPRQITDAGLSMEPLRGFLRPPGDKPYGRKLIFENHILEVILMNWAPQRASLPHDHGASEGWVMVMSGTAEHHWHSPGDGRQIADSGTSFSEGTLFFAPRGQVHVMRNPLNIPLITLHFYFPPIRRMEVFEPALGCTAIVTDDCGAWWPDAAQIVTQRKLAAVVE